MHYRKWKSRGDSTGVQLLLTMNARHGDLASPLPDLLHSEQTAVRAMLCHIQDTVLVHVQDKDVELTYNLHGGIVPHHNVSLPQGSKYKFSSASSCLSFQDYSGSEGRTC